MRPTWLIFGMMLSTSLLAQQVTNVPPAAAIENPASAPALTNTNGPAAQTAAPGEAAKEPAAKKAGKKKAAPRKTAAPQLKTVPLIPGPAVVVASRVNVRGQAKINSEVVTQLNKGQDVTVLEEITLKNSGPDEPSAWAKIQLPANVHVWVNGSFIDAANKTVSPRRLNFRSGPGENYSILGRLQRGTPVKEVSTKGEWMQIEAPTNAYAFVAAQYLKQEPATPAATPTETTPTQEPVTEPPAVAAAPTESPAAADASAAAKPATTTAPQPVADEPPPPRIIQREGFVRGSVSIQAPTHFELLDPENGKVIEYLFTTSPDLDLKRYKGLHVYVTGEEGLDERWPNTPVLTIHKLEVLD